MFKHFARCGVVTCEEAMPPTATLDEVLCIVATWDRPQLIRQFQEQKTRFPIDFTPDFYQTQPVERLRHIYVAMLVQHRRSVSMVA